MDPCYMCDYQCPEKERLDDHLVECHQISTCTLCDYRTQPKENLRYHMRRSHYKVTDRCDRCEFVCYVKGELSKHEETVHRNPRQ